MEITRKKRQKDASLPSLGRPWRSQCLALALVWSSEILQEPLLDAASAESPAAYQVTLSPNSPPESHQTRNESHPQELWIVQLVQTKRKLSPPVLYPIYSCQSFRISSVFEATNLQRVVNTNHCLSLPSVCNGGDFWKIQLLVKIKSPSIDQDHLTFLVHPPPKLGASEFLASKISFGILEVSGRLAAMHLRLFISGIACNAVKISIVLDVAR